MWSVSLVCMRESQRYCLLLVLIAALVSPLSGATPWTPDGPLLADKAGRPIWFDTETLLKSATHCVAPQMPALARQARIDGFVLLDILVDGKGKVACVQLVHGHPVLAGSAIDAAKEWTFRGRKQKRREVSFYGHLRFHFTTGQTAKNENPCTVAHW
jgi:TonB family protein